MILVTGAAGLIGSALLWALNQRGETNIIAVDTVDHDEKEHNLAPLQYEQLLSPAEFRTRLSKGDFNKQNMTTLFHLGAISSTSESNWERLQDNNVAFSQEVIRWCVDRGVRCVYASSAQTYGNGEQGYSDDHDRFDQLETITLYGKSKLLVDRWARDAGYLQTVVGLRYFNVFGPNENHKEHMRSVIAKAYPQLKKDGTINLFRSYRPDVADGEQQRDFLYVKDAVAATLFFLDHTGHAGVYNIGSGQAKSWNEVARAMGAALNITPDIRYIEMPIAARAGYQYFTQADLSKLHAAGYTTTPTSLTDSIRDYIQNYLEPHLHLGQKSDTDNSI